MKIYIVYIALLTSCLSLSNKEEKMMCFEIEKNDITATRLTSVSIENIHFDDFETGVVLLKKSSSKSKEINFQIDNKQKKLWFKHNPLNESGSIKYCLIKKKNSAVNTQFKYEKTAGDLTLISKEKALVTYRYGMTYPPKGVDSIYKKSGYIHPILSPKGDTLTRIQPPDHFHHYGLWGPWTRTKIDSEKIDFWNLKDGQGTVLFKEFNSIQAGSIFAAFDAKQEHLILENREIGEVAVNENLKIKMWKVDGKDQYILDYTSEFSSPLPNGILFEAYRYGGGLGLRFTERWQKDNCTVFTSSGKDRLTADGSEAKWCIVTGESDDGKSTNGILFMSHPENKSHPEPMRVWPIDGNKGRGDLFFEFCPIRHNEWKIEPQRKYNLKYRMLVFDGNINPEEAERHWQAFAENLKITINKN